MQSYKGKRGLGEGIREGLAFHLRVVKEASIGVHLELDGIALDLGSQYTGSDSHPKDVMSEIT